uniref:DUF3615 domain-containing protein n=1 Tax=Oryza glumipatula TaxID=40148 RepID=A0A0E0B9G0_9ORYZ
MDSRSSVKRSPRKPLPPEACQGKSSYFQEHHAMLENNGKSPYHHAPHAWRFAFCPPISDSPQAATVIPPIKRKNYKDDLEHHISITKKALNSYNMANGDLDYEFAGGTRISTIAEFGSTYHHCNFLVFSPTTRTIHLFFAEFDANTQDERGVHETRADAQRCHGRVTSSATSQAVITTYMHNLRKTLRNMPGWYVSYVMVTQLGQGSLPSMTHRWAVDQWLATDEPPHMLTAERKGCSIGAVAS